MTTQSARHVPDLSISTAPVTGEGWVARACAVATQLAVGAIGCDQVAPAPDAEVRLLKDSGLVGLLGPEEYGGGGQTWSTALRVVRAVAAADSVVAQLLGYHYLWAATRDVATLARLTQENLLVTGALDPRAIGLRAREVGDDLVLLGAASFPAGGCASDRAVLVGVVDGSGRRVATVVPTDQAAIHFLGAPGKAGRAEVGDALVDGVRVGVGASDEEPERLFPLVQLLFAHLYLGLVDGALATAAAGVRDLPDRRYAVLAASSELRGRLAVAEALVERAVGLLGGDRDPELTASAGAARRVALDLGLEVGVALDVLVDGPEAWWRGLHARRRHDPAARE